MPGYVEGQAVQLGIGQNVAVLDSETISSGMPTEAVYLTPGYGGAVPLTILNLSGQDAVLQVAAKNQDDQFFPWTNIDTNTFASTDAGAMFGEVTPGLFYRLVPSGDVMQGTLVIAR